MSNIFGGSLEGIDMLSEDKELLFRVAPAYITAAAIAAYTIFELRKINRQRKQSAIEHEVRMADMRVAANERIEKFVAWRAAQPNVEEILKQAEETVGSIEDLRAKMNDPNHVWIL